MATIMFPESAAYTSVNDSSAKRILGERVEVDDATYGRRTYRYWLNTDAVATTAGHLMTFSHDAVGYVTADVSEGTAQFAGIALGVVSAGYCGWFVCGTGDHAYVLTSGAATAQAVAMPHSTNGEAVDFADGSEEFAFGAFLASNGTTTEAGTTVMITKGS